MCNPSHDELQASKAVYDNVVKYLSSRFFFVMLTLTLLSPVIGLILGVLVESKIFDASRDELLKEAAKKADLAEQRLQALSNDAEKKIASTSETASEYLSEIRSTRDALDFVMRGTQTGELVFLKERSDQVEQQLRELNQRVSDWEHDISKKIPEGVARLHATGQDYMRLKVAVEALEKLFAEDERAPALAGAFYRIDEFVGEFEVQLFVPQELEGEDLDALKNAEAELRVDVEFRQAGKATDQHSFRWSGVKPSLAINDVRSNANGNGPLLGNYGTPSARVVSIKISLENQAPWWRIADAVENSLKRVNILQLSDFNEIEISVSVPESQNRARKVLSSCTLSGKPIPRCLRLDAHVNRVPIELVHDNPGDVTVANPYPGEIKDVAPVQAVEAVAESPGQEAVQAVDAKPGMVTFRFGDTQLFSRAASKYTEELGGASKALLKNSARDSVE